MTIALRQGRFESRMRFRFKHASAARSKTANVIVELRDENGVCGYGEGCPRDYVTGETVATAGAFIAAHGREVSDAIADVTELTAWIEAHGGLIDADPAAFCAMELAALDLLAKRRGVPLETIIGAPALAAPVHYTAVMGDSSPRKTALAATAYRLWGFTDFKIKLSGDLARDQARLRRLPRRARVRVDANNYWRNAADAIAYMRSLKRPIWAIEEPAAAGDEDAMRAIAEALEVKIILDESLTRREQLEQYSSDAARWIANVRVSKCGGIVRSARLARQAQAAGIGVIIGAHVGETSLLTRAALAVGQCLAQPPLAREGAYGTILLQSDLAQPALRFERGGKLVPTRYGLATRAGMGGEITADAVDWRPSG